MASTYNTIVKMANDGELRARIVACAAKEGVIGPDAWVSGQVWELCAASDIWADAYQYRVDVNTSNAAMDPPGEIIDPGYSEGVIADNDILAVVQPRKPGA